jgi:hypothetical protein
VCVVCVCVWCVCVCVVCYVCVCVLCVVCCVLTLCFFVAEHAFVLSEQIFQCCPTNFTEQYYVDHPEAYATHPPVFLTQTSTTDNHADLCACKHYYDTLVAHGVKAELELVDKADESCFCIGTPSNPAAAGSPFSHLCSLPTWGQNCDTMGGPNCCIAHTMGNAGMVEPLTTFVISAAAGTI